MTKSEKKDQAGPLQWYFPSTDHGKEDGFNDSMLEYFQGVDHANYIAREAIQNAVDARLIAKDPVRIVFERFVMSADEMPGREQFSEKLRRCLEFVKGQPDAEEFFRAAESTIRKSKISVLKISDFNTVGLTGSDDDRAGNWHRLVRAAGVSNMKGVGGGSFGIGKGAAIVASSLRTVFYSSINEKGESVFQGAARLVSHYDDAGDVRQGVGFFGIDGYKSIRDASRIPVLFRRAERGTDIFVVGYEPGAEWQTKLVSSVLHNFWLAVLHGDLEVVIRDSGKNELAITRSTLRDMLNEYDAEDAKFFYEAVVNPTQEFTKELGLLGEVKLSIRKQDGYPHKVMMARKPKMRVQERTSFILREPFAGVLLCADDRGNALLRKLEPPAHDKWDKNRSSEGPTALNELNNFLAKSLRSMAETVASEPQDIPGLDRYLPDNEERDYLPKDGMALEPTDTEGGNESGREIGLTSEQRSEEVSPVVRKGTISKKQPGKIKLTPPKGPNDGKTGRPTGGEDGDSHGVRIKTSSISFRGFIQKGKEGLEYRLVINAREDCEGAIRLVAVGDDANYPVEVLSAKDFESKKDYETSGALIKGLSVKADKSIRLIVRLNSAEKYSIGIENYEG